MREGEKGCIAKSASARIRLWISGFDSGPCYRQGTPRAQKANNQLASIKRNWHSLKCEAVVLHRPRRDSDTGNRLRLSASGGAWTCRFAQYRDRRRCKRRPGRLLFSACPHELAEVGSGPRRL